MIKIYYTTTLGENTIQDKFQSSLGGYRSVTQFNGGINSLFGEITDYTVSVADRDQYIALIIKNDSINPVTNINVWFDYPESSYSKLYISAVELSEDPNGVKYMESIANINVKPVYSEFFEADGEENKQDIGSLEPGDMLGIWIKRELFNENIESDKDIFVDTDPDNNDRVIQVNKDKSDTIQMFMSYDEES